MARLVDAQSNMCIHCNHRLNPLHSFRNQRGRCIYSVIWPVMNEPKWPNIFFLRLTLGVCCPRVICSSFLAHGAVYGGWNAYSQLRVAQCPSCINRQHEAPQCRDLNQTLLWLPSDRPQTDLYQGCALYRVPCMQKGATICAPKVDDKSRPTGDAAARAQWERHTDPSGHLTPDLSPQAQHVHQILPPRQQHDATPRIYVIDHAKMILQLLLSPFCVLRVVRGSGALRRQFVISLLNRLSLNFYHNGSTWRVCHRPAATAVGQFGQRALSRASCA